MAKSALVTGSTDRIALVRSALEEAGLEVFAADDPGKVAETCWASQEGFDAYVQLPTNIPTNATSLVGQIGILIEKGILGRFREAELVLAYLAPGAHVVLVAGNLPADLSAPDDHEARMALLRVLSHALRAERAPAGGRVSVLAAGAAPEEIACAALGEQPGKQAVPDFAALWPDMPYDEWRLRVMDLSVLES
ncbi:MAG: hypothetical protein M1115_04210 [Actinobacteria bacterium]|nr:hypothetical protein [Actinomycetota bacterium]